VNKQPYQDQCIALATKHSKEIAIAPHFHEHLKANLIVPKIDTDQFGTFSREVERKGNSLEVAEKKVRLGMEVSGLSYGLASEGSFGPHPAFPFLSCDNELMLFIDNERGFKLHEIELSEETNYSHICVTTLEETKSFLEKALFPTHAVIVRPNLWNEQNIIFKGVSDLVKFEQAFTISQTASKDGKVWLETDMRAHFNPSRMKIISRLAYRLSKRLSSLCQSCNTPGWGIVEVEKGLPCEYCNQPTDMIAYEIYGCVLCDYTQRLFRSDGIKVAQPMNCPRCNP